MHFSDCNLAKFASELFENDEPMLEIARCHRDSFVNLYGNVNHSRIHVWSSSNSGMHIAVLFFLKKGTN